MATRRHRAPGDQRTCGTLAQADAPWIGRCEREVGDCVAQGDYHDDRPTTTATAEATRTGIIDCDVHPGPRSTRRDPRLYADALARPLLRRRARLLRQPGPRRAAGQQAARRRPDRLRPRLPAPAADRRVRHRLRHPAAARLLQPAPRPGLRHRDRRRLQRLARRHLALEVQPRRRLQGLDHGRAPGPGRRRRARSSAGPAIRTSSR